MASARLLDHFRAVRKWAERFDADIFLDVRTFSLEVRLGADAYRLHPIFPAVLQGRLVHVTSLTDEVTGFGGWLPYRPYRAPLSTDKFIFKEWCARHKIRAPQYWRAQDRPTKDFIVKNSQGSFGYNMGGPYKAYQPVDWSRFSVPGAKGEAFADEFVQGSITRVWYWGRTPIAAQIQQYPKIVGDGHSTVGELAERLIGNSADSKLLSDAQILADCLAYHNLASDQILSTGVDHWIDFRYGRSFQSQSLGEAGLDALKMLREVGGDQVDKMGRDLELALQTVAAVPVMCTADAILDPEGYIWWLEVNSNSFVPYQGYEVMLSSLFGSRNAPMFDAR